MHFTAIQNKIKLKKDGRSSPTWRWPLGEDGDVKRGRAGPGAAGLGAPERRAWSRCRARDRCGPPGRTSGRREGGDQACGGLEGARGVHARQHHESQRSRATSRPPRDGGAEPGSGSTLPVLVPGSSHLLTGQTRPGGADGAPRGSRREGTSGGTRTRRRGGRGPHAPDPLLCGRAAGTRPCPRSAVSAGPVLLRGHTGGDRKPPLRPSPRRAASKPFLEGQSTRHHPKQTRRTHRAPRGDAHAAGCRGWGAQGSAPRG